MSGDKRPLERNSRDRRGEEMTAVLLIRHGESEANRAGYFAGQSDAALLEKGFLQAKLTAEFIRDNYRVTGIYASDLKRAYDTGKVLGDLIGITPVSDIRLREIYAGKWQGMRFGDIEDTYGEAYRTWRYDIGNCVPTEGESVKELGRRVMECLEDIAARHDGEVIAVATHATPIRAIQCMISGPGFDGMKDIPWVTNASVTEISLRDGQWRIEKLCMDAHLSSIRTAFPANV